MADELADRETLAALREAADSDAPDAGYNILWHPDGTVVLVVVGAEDDDPLIKFGMPRDVARRMGKRLLVAAERARRARRPARGS